ncbi:MULTISPECIES: folylpolyglutamate synthase/dihydrofolate synthase family protein [unclassified Breznakia]|uniref:bifunctional folylpolyglutamate synthase/dihydrofolate synthase n=1 Tax=unclassified Breznakia TaxID=2623764 RepID=UPI002475155C|nr:MULTISPECIES: folylpolyglutamate synthase/dihydrofolate synthase family protein [unclassified Breznakia]MDH6366602.1 dihydrofolate synthase/folylpolyglutamate synthase [Breznakia sp. PH1-1]MDH6403695.1 dihydrofolate synthase/folylpolyglutamate synthase [Breznakia sp. PF1-11]MDH6411404.1 dihydrofolate synthase/folylpolyglutamate synthase [Breznakia sp. PFB1-11]MDH6413865.1 dihydrofolate synthase/folylpolyglutamate synthase [Breznakia sp. PFB1-14]MDH6416295.1 dihydrofolate synthase/folylpolyg
MMKFTNSKQVIDKIEVKKRNGLQLLSLKAFMEEVGNPHLQLKCIHVAGTNGKGSTVNAMNHVLMEAGYKVGTFTSPYLESHHDRIRINDTFISDQAIVDYANTYYEKWVEHDLSMFEIDMFIAAQYFVDQKVDLAIFEVGMGGDRDATNIIFPMISVITNIGLDHMEFLGKTYVEIAEKKAGIIKAHTPLVTMERRQECLDVFANVCKQVDSPMIVCDDPRDVYVDDMLHFTYRDMHFDQQTLAKYQAKNSSLAIEALLQLRQRELVTFSDQDLHQGIRNAIWKGRFEEIQKHPRVIIDGAHNVEGMRALVDSCREYDNIRVLFSALADKPYGEMIDLLMEISDDITVCEFDFPRAATAETIAAGKNVKIIKDYRKAINELMDESHILLVCGSLYFIAEVRDMFLKKGESTLS